ncbi:MAG: BRCT domain-containing protein [Snowella sp.]|nr:BRCT domain-containing protein [Snowella sp.]
MINDWVYPLGGLFTVVGGIALFLQMRRASEEQQVVILEEHTHADKADKAALEKSKTDLETRLSTSEEATQSYKQEALSLHGKVHHLEKDLAHLQQHLQEREEENSHLRQQAAQFKQASESLHQQFSQLEVFHEQLKASHQREIQELQKSKEGLSLRLQQEMSKLADLRSQVLGLEQNQERQQQQAIRVQELEKSQQDWSAEKSALVAQSQLQLERVETLERALEQEQTTVKVLNSQIESLQKTIAEWESQYQGAIALTDNLNLQVQTLETEKGEWQALEGDLRQQLANLESLEQQAKSQGEVLTAQVQTLEGQIKTLEASLETDRQGFLQAQTQWESDRQGFLNAQAQWESDRQSLEMTQKTQESAYQDLKSQFDILQEQWEALSTDKVGLESQLQAEQFKVADLEQQLTKLQASTVLTNEATVPEKSAQPLETNEVSSVSTESKSPKRSGKKVSKTKALEPHIEPQTLAAEISEGKVEPEAIAVETVETISLDSSELPASKLSSEVSNETTSIPTAIIETAIDTAPSAPEIAAEELPSVTAEMVEIHHDTETTAAEMVHEPALLADKKFIILGTLSHIDRDRAKELIQTAGGTLMSSPSAKTDYALVGKSPGEKLKKVQKLGISQLSESQFLKLLGIES